MIPLEGVTTTVKEAARYVEPASALNPVHAALPLDEAAEWAETWLPAEFAGRGAVVHRTEPDYGPERVAPRPMNIE